MPLSKEEIKKISIEILSKLTKKDIENFLNITNYAVKTDKEVIIRRGNKSKKAFLILKGTVRGYFFSEAGAEKNVLLRAEGFFVGDARKLFNDEPQKYTYEAIGKSHILFFNYPDFEALAIKNPNIMQLLLNILKEIIILQNYRIETMISMTAEERYLDLIKMSPKFLEKTYLKHIANFLGITPVSLSRIIKRVKEKQNYKNHTP